MTEYASQDASRRRVPEEEAVDSREEHSPDGGKEEEVGSAFDATIRSIVMCSVAGGEPC